MCCEIVLILLPCTMYVLIGFLDSIGIFHLTVTRNFFVGQEELTTLFLYVLVNENYLFW